MQTCTPLQVERARAGALAGLAAAAGFVRAVPGRKVARSFATRKFTTCSIASLLPAMRPSTRFAVGFRSA